MIKRGELVCANLGDSRATACVQGMTKALTCDHNTANPRERERVVAMGGTIKENRQVYKCIHSLIKVHFNNLHF